MFLKRLAFSRVSKPASRLTYSTASGAKSNANGIRNIGIIAHIDAGKTTTTERMLYYAGVTRRLGDVDSGDTVTDFLPAERERGITIQSAAISLPWNNTQINLIDTPGHADFAFEVVRSLRVLDGAVTILDAVAGVEALTETVWQRAKKQQIPIIAYINKMDRAGAGYGRTVREIISRLQTRVVQLVIPYFDGDVFKGVYDVLRRERIVYVGSGSDGREVKVEPALDETEDAYSAIVDTMSELSEAVVEEFVVNDSVSPETLLASIKAATLDGTVTPVLCGASFRNIGVQPLLDNIVELLPPPKKSERPNLTCSLAFKVRNDPMLGPLVYVRVYDGALRKGMSVLNTSNGETEKVTKLLRMKADSHEEVSEIKAGDIGVILGSKKIRTGDTIVVATRNSQMPREARSMKLLPISIPPPVFMSRINPHTVSEERTMKSALDILLREDPSLRLEFDDDAGQWLLSGLGELHLEVARDRLVQDLGANVDFSPAMITYKEAITIPSEATNVWHSPQGPEIRVTVKVEPRHQRDSDLTNIGEENGISCQINRHPTISQEFAEKEAAIGVKPVLSQGRRSCFATYGTKITISCNVPPEVFDPPLASLIRDATKKAFDQIALDNWTVLEPMMSLVITAPEGDIGTVMTDLSGNRRGRIDDVGTSAYEGGHQYSDMSRSIWTPSDHTMYLIKGDTKTPAQIRAIAPLRKLLGYVTSLRSMTQGRGSFEMTFNAFEPMAPQDIKEVQDQNIF